MARLLMLGESPNYANEWFDIHDGQPSASSQGGAGIGTTPAGNVSRWSFTAWEDQRFDPTLISRQFDTPVSEAWMRFHFFGNGFNRAADRRIFGLRLGDFGVSVPILNFVQRDNATTDQFGPRLYSSTGTILAEIAANLFNTNDVDLWEVHVVLDPVNGVFDLYKNGTLIFTYAGGLVGPSGETTFDTVCFGAGVPVEGADPGIYNQAATSSNLARYTFDNFALNSTAGTVNNGRIGDGIIVRLTPNGDGSFSQLMNANGSSANNFEHANRGGEGWVYPTAAGQRDSYEMSYLDPEFGNVNALEWRATARKNGPNINNIRFSLKPTGQADFQAAAATPIPAEAVTDPDADSPLVTRIIEVNPNTGVGFTAAEINGCEAGIAFEA